MPFPAVPAAGRVQRMFVSRAGQKLEQAMATFRIDVAGAVCADLGSNTGGFVDCLLQHGADRIFAVDPSYGVLDYRLRRDPRVVVFERTNALRFVAPELCDLVTIDVGWTPQRLILPAARRCLKPDGRAVTLVKPQYEARPEQLQAGVVLSAQIAAVLVGCRADIAALGWQIIAETESPIRGHGGNVEYLWLLAASAG